MRIGIFGDTHDHLDNIRLAVAELNRHEVELVVFSGDLVSTFAIPPLRKLNAPMIMSFGDNEGNKRGIIGGMRIIGSVAEPPFGFQAADGTKFLVTHQYEHLKGMEEGADVIVYGHTHKPRVHREESGRLYINPGETSGWTYKNPTIAILDTNSMDAEIIALNECVLESSS